MNLGLLQGVNYGVFGLGNKQYVDFCAVGKRVHKAMQTCGAQPVIHNGEGNDEADINADFRLWKESLFNALDLSDLFQSTQKVIIAFHIKLSIISNFPKLLLKIKCGRAAHLFSSPQLSIM